LALQDLSIAIMNASSGNLRGFAYIAAAIVVAGALISASLIAPSIETPKTSTSTETTTLPVSTVTDENNVTTVSMKTMTLPGSTVTHEKNFTTVLISATTVTLTMNVSSCNTPGCPPIIINNTNPCSDGLATQSTTTAAISSFSSSSSPATVGASGTGSATNSSSERKTLVAAGLIWVFYTDGCNIDYQTSSDGGSVWSSPTIARMGIVRGWFFTVAQSGTTLYFVCAASDGSLGGDIAFRYGTMNGNGTITWPDQEQDIPYGGNVGTVPTVAVDSSGNVWIALEDYGGTATSPVGALTPPVAANARAIYVLNNATGAWRQVFALSGLYDYPRPILLPLASGKMALEILTETPGNRQVVVYTSANAGQSWSNPVYTPPDNIYTLSAVSAGDTIYSVTTDTSGNVSFWSYTYGASSFVGPAPLLARCYCSENYDDAVISGDGGSYLFVAYSNSTSILDETSTDSGASWSASAALTTTENQIQPGSLAINQVTTGVVSVIWTAVGNIDTQTYSVRFALGSSAPPSPR
jgi:hypothetical protein